jgi:hypothetical protein
VISAVFVEACADRARQLVDGALLLRAERGVEATTDRAVQNRR